MLFSGVVWFHSPLFIMDGKQNDANGKHSVFKGFIMTLHACGSFPALALPCLITFVAFILFPSRFSSGSTGRPLFCCSSFFSHPAPNQSHQSCQRLIFQLEFAIALNFIRGRLPLKHFVIFHAAYKLKIQDSYCYAVLYCVPPDGTTPWCIPREMLCFNNVKLSIEDPCIWRGGSSIEIHGVVWLCQTIA